MKGATIRGYKITDVIQQDHTTGVFRARHPNHSYQFVIKVVYHDSQDDDFATRFLSEAKRLSQIQHPHLTLVYEYGAIEGGLFLAMEALQGETLHELLQKKKRLSAEHAIRLLRECALGLAALHQNSLLHSNVAPTSVFLTSIEDQVHVKWIAYGIARQDLISSQLVTIKDIPMKNCEYWNPEFCGLIEEDGTLDQRADIYSLGAIFFRMITGRPPVIASSPQECLLKILHDRPERPSAVLIPGEIPSALDAIVQKMLAKNRQDRYTNVSDLLADLDSNFPKSELLLERTAILQKSDSVEKGKLFAGRFLIESKLGEGGMGVVYKATDKILNMPVALKILRPYVVHDQQAVDRLKSEVILARKVDHPNVCRVYDIGESEGTHYVSMEYISGKTLAQIMQERKRLPPETSLAIIKQVLLALREAHRAGVIHRDLKPHNIMIDSNHSVFITDFGISISMEASRLGKSDAVLGTPYYMPPEGFDGRFDQRTDLYAIGVILYEMSTGSLPFTGNGPAALLVAHLKANPKKPTDLVPGFSPELEKIILKTLAKSPDDRYQTARKLLHALEPLCGPSTTAFEYKQESMVQRLLLEKKYSKALRLARSLVRQNPENASWLGLLKSAQEKQLQHRIRRVRRLIRHGDVPPAASLLTKLKNSRLSEKDLTRIKQLENLLYEKQQPVVSTKPAARVSKPVEAKNPAPPTIEETKQKLLRNDPPVPAVFPYPALKPERKFIPEAPRSEAKSKRWLWIVPVLLLLLSGAAALWHFLPASPAPKGSVQINVLPWAKVSVVPAGDDKSVEECFTPCFLTLEKGEYTVQFENVNYAPASKRVQVKSGEVSVLPFSFPQYKAENIVKELGE
jgi:serine/threonine protein kinase